MNSQFNYATFVELFLKPDDEHPATALPSSPALERIETDVDHGNNISFSPPA